MPRALVNLAAVMIRPRATMRRILDAGRDRMIIPLVLLALLCGYLGDMDKEVVEALHHQRVPFALLVAGIFLCITAVLVGIFYLCAWGAYWIGRLLEGSGTPREVRSALAWGLAPAIWALVYRIPAVIYSPQSLQTKFRIGKDIAIDAGQTSAGCFVAILLALLELTACVWWVATTSNTLGEAHRFSSWRGLATMALVAISPLVIAAAAVLAS